MNILTFAIGMFATSRIVGRFGMPTTLALIPVVITAGLLILAFSPILIVVLGLQVTRRAGNYAITRPGREMLFTAVDRETRFKAKPVIDIAVYRGGDALSSIAFAGLTDGARAGTGVRWPALGGSSRRFGPPWAAISAASSSAARRRSRPQRPLAPRITA